MRSIYIERIFFQSAFVSMDLPSWPNNGCVSTNVLMHHMDADYAYRKKSLTTIVQECNELYEQLLKATSHKKATERPPTSHLENYPD